MVRKLLKYNSFRIITLSAFGLAFCGIAIILIILFWPQNDLNSNVKIKIPKGATLSNIAEILSEKDMLNNQKVFINAAKIMGYSNKIPAGIFVVSEANTNYDIVKKLVSGNPETIKITFVEGWTIPQSVKILAESLNISSEVFTKLCYDKDFIQEFGIDAPSLEGYLYPETYLFLESEDDPKEILKQLVSEYNQVITEDMRKRAEQLGFSMHEILTIASLIEGEAIFGSERNIISAVYHNRLKKRMLLQADPTIQYILKEEPRRLLYSDLKVDSPYNTYLYKGLPPGPIGNPSKQSIVAALYPDDNDYIFFVARGDGYHTFTRTIKEHNQAKREFQKVRQLATQG